MDLYSRLAPHYDAFFPQSPQATAFLLGLGGRAGARGQSRGAKASPLAVDIGCATGSQVLDLSAAGWQAIGWEPCAAMLEIARRKAREQGLTATFEPYAMQDIASRLEPGSVDLALCLGNTLPHLGGEGELARFVADIARVLARGGSVVLQLVNYERILGLLEGGEHRFPILRSGKVSFERSYSIAEDGGLVFHAELDEDGRSFVEDNRLLPFARAAIVAALEGAGFERIEARSGWDRASFDPGKDAYLIITARSRS
jgi:glycine/sarcosine N-methyltransferase